MWIEKHDNFEIVSMNLQGEYGPLAVVLDIGSFNEYNAYFIHHKSKEDPEVTLLEKTSTGQKHEVHMQEGDVLEGWYLADNELGREQLGLVQSKLTKSIIEPGIKISLEKPSGGL